MYQTPLAEYLKYAGALIIFFVIIYLTMKVLGMVHSVSINLILLIFIAGQSLLNIYFWKKLKKK